MKLIDQSLELVTLAARAAAVAAVLATVACPFAFVWTGDTRWLTTCGIAAAVAAGAGWTGFYLLGNEEWARATKD